MVNNFKIYKNFNLSKKEKGAIILIGNFDGLHRGHQKLFNKAKSFKKKLGEVWKHRYKNNFSDQRPPPSTTKQFNFGGGKKKTLGHLFQQRLTFSSNPLLK